MGYRYLERSHHVPRVFNVFLQFPETDVRPLYMFHMFSIAGV